MAIHFGENGGSVTLGRRGPGVCWTCLRPYFNERHGLRRPFLRMGRWRFFWLGRRVRP